MMRLLLAATIGNVLAFASLQAAEIHVAVDGNDAWSGRLPAANAERTDGPLATVGRARDVVRQLRAAGLKEPVRVIVGGGTYFLPEPLLLKPEDSGTEEFPTTYVARAGEKPILSGGRAITNWRKPDRGNVWTAELPEVKAGPWYFHQLFVGGEQRVRARMPNTGYFLNEGPIKPLTDRRKAMSDPEAKNGFRFKPGDIGEWTNLDDANLLQFHSWTASVHWIKEIDRQNHIVRFTAPSGWPTGYWTDHERYYVENFPEALDSPGEWYLDRSTGVLSYWPMPGEDPSRLEVIAPRLRQLVRLEGLPEQQRFVEWIDFDGLSFQHADWEIADHNGADGQAAAFLDAAVHARGARHCLLERCEIAHVGEYALWFAAGSTDNRVAACHLHDLSGGGIKIGEISDPPTEALVAGRNTVDNCFIHDTGHMFHAGVGVWIGRSSGNTVTHNEICDLDYTGVSVGWSWGYAPSSANHNVVEYNHIHHIGRQVLGDMGGIYTLGISPGTRIRHNVIYDIYSPGVGGGTGIYPDEGSSQILIENNLVYHTELGCFSQHYGRENTVRNNIFALSRAGEVSRYRQEEHISFFFERNIVYSDNGWFFNGNWSNGNYRMDNNLYWDTATGDPDFDELSFDEWQALGRDQRSLLADPLFVDAAGLDFRLKPGTPAEKLGFQPFDVSAAGLYGDPAWVDLPKAIARPPLKVAPLPRRGPLTLDEGFESTPVGEKAALATTSEEAGTTVRVSDEAAAAGRRSLKFSDAAGLRHNWQPHIYYEPRIRSGTVRLGFAVRLEAGAEFFHEWRDGAQPYAVGLSLRITPEGQLSAQGRPLARVPIGQWVRLELTATVGRQARGKYSLRLAVPGESPREFNDLAVGNPNWRSLRWLGFISLADKPSVIYLDDISLHADK